MTKKNEFRPKFFIFLIFVSINLLVSTLNFSGANLSTALEFDTDEKFPEFSFQSNLSSLDLPSILLNTVFGGNKFESIKQMKIDSFGNIIIAGDTSSSDFPSKNTFKGGDDGFLAEFDKNGKMLFITYIGGSKYDMISDLELSSNGNIIVVGDTMSEDFLTINGFDDSFNGYRDGFICVFSKNGNLLSSTYLGGSGFDSIGNIEVDKDNNIIVAGYTVSTDFPTRKPSVKTRLEGSDLFIAKFDESLNLKFSTFIGGSEGEYYENCCFFRIDNTPINLQIDSNSNIYIAGSTGSVDFPTLHAFNSVFGGGEYSASPFCPCDIFLTELSPTGSLKFSTFIGGSAGESLSELIVDDFDSVILSGITSSSDFPIKNAFQPKIGGQMDGFLIKFDVNNKLVFSSFIGGMEDEYINDIVLEGRHPNKPDSKNIFVDGLGNIYLSGKTNSSDFSTLNAFDSSYGGNDDGFVTKIDAKGKLIFRTFLGGTQFEAIDKILVNSNGIIYVTGRTKSIDFPLFGFNGSFNEKQENFLTIFNFDGSILFSSYIDDSNVTNIEIRSGKTFEQMEFYHDTIILSGYSNHIILVKFNNPYGGLQKDNYALNINNFFFGIIGLSFISLSVVTVSIFTFTGFSNSLTLTSGYQKSKIINYTIKNKRFIQEKTIDPTPKSSWSFIIIGPVLALFSILVYLLNTEI
jgi:hypothetical protein